MWYKKRNCSKFKGFILGGMVLLLSQCLIAHTAQAQDELSQLQVMWRNGSYSEVLPSLIEFRDRPYGRNAQVDYMIATSACRIPALQEEAYKFFCWILYHYSLDETSREQVKDEMQQCDPSNQPRIIAFVTERSERSIVRGKTFFWLDRENPVTSDPVKVVRDIPLEELRDRLFEISDSRKGIYYVQELLGLEFQVESLGHFILVSSSRHTQSEVRSIGRNLEQVLHFFAWQYKIPIPHYLITVYIVPTAWELMELAEKIHGIRISRTDIGYSFQNDLSIVGVIPGKYPGTLRHELFHLMVRNDFGDIPPWLDEGMAALYEVSQIIGVPEAQARLKHAGFDPGPIDGILGPRTEQALRRYQTEHGLPESGVLDEATRSSLEVQYSIVGLPNWRGSILQRFWDIRPSIKELVKMDWSSFGRGQTLTQTTTNHALARYFILYLQDRQKLVEVYKAFRGRKVTNVQVDPRTDAVYLLENILQKSLVEVDRDFTEWFRQLNH